MHLTPWLLEFYFSKKSVKYGIPQGSVLGPFFFFFFFCLFINDLPLHVKDISVDCDMLADDSTAQIWKRYANQKQYARQLRSGIQLV